jgi:hypothetical protein
MKIQVTAEDIREARERVEKARLDGTSNLSEVCPIALAAARAFGVEKTFVSTEIFVDHRRFSLPLEASHFMRDFDGGWTVYPFEFESERIVRVLVARI